MQVRRLNFAINSLIIFQLSEFILKSQQQGNGPPVSPCPNVFLYKFDGQEWYGEIKASTASVTQKSKSMLKVTMALRIAHNVSNFQSTNTSTPTIFIVMVCFVFLFVRKRVKFARQQFL